MTSSYQSINFISFISLSVMPVVLSLDQHDQMKSLNLHHQLISWYITQSRSWLPIGCSISPYRAMCPSGHIRNSASSGLFGSSADISSSTSSVLSYFRVILHHQFIQVDIIQQLISEGLHRHSMPVNLRHLPNCFFRHYLSVSVDLHHYPVSVGIHH